MSVVFTASTRSPIRSLPGDHYDADHGDGGEGMMMMVIIRKVIIMMIMMVLVVTTMMVIEYNSHL